MSSGLPRLLFFSGGSALRDLAREMAAREQPSIHLVSTFDSGGSSARLRDAFAMPAVGDLRNRLLALAWPPDSPLGKFLAGRLPANGDPAPLWREMRSFPARAESLGASGAAAAACLADFLRRCPPCFDPRNASVGNLALAGAYLGFQRDFGPTMRLFSSLLRTRGEVWPICAQSLHLAAELAGGARVVGQHEFKHLGGARVEKIFLTVHAPGRGPAASCRPMLYPEARERLAVADLICFPMGSFYSSLLANLLPRGTGRAVAQNRCPRVFVPNSGHDPEIGSLSVAEQARLVCSYLDRDLREAADQGPRGTDAGSAQECAPGRHKDCLKDWQADWPDRPLLSHVLIDPENGRYQGGFGNLEALAERGIEVIRAPIVSPGEPARHDAHALLPLLRELACA